MSGTDVKRAMSPTVNLEKNVLTEMLQLFKSFPCLWDQKHALYGQKEARDAAFEVLLDKYKLIEPDSNIFDVKKKIEYMRCAYRREHKRVLVALHRGGTHIPRLWYYDLLRFLNDHHNDHKPKNYDLHETQEIDDSDEESSPLLKRRKVSNRSSNVIFIPEQHNGIEELEDQSENYQDDQSQSYIVGNEAEAFGRTLGFQLKELNHMQRVFAEKLISDVIFQARLCNLSAKTSLNLNN